MVQENESMKEKVEELSLELEILRSEVSDGGMTGIPFFTCTVIFTGIEGAATNAEIKTLTEQNTKLKEAVVRYNFISHAWIWYKCSPCNSEYTIADCV
jgi:dynactin 1